MFKFNICTFATHLLPGFSTLLCASDVYIEVVFKVLLQLPGAFPVPKLISRSEE